MNKLIKAICFGLLLLSSTQIFAQKNFLKNLKSPIIFKGDEKTAYRDPAILFHDKTMYLFFTLVRTEEGNVYSYTAMSKSKDLKNWSPMNGFYVYKLILVQIIKSVKCPDLDLAMPACI
jgi:sucrose-6-phosphate hydrolase SacC (GH32 family)